MPTEVKRYLCSDRTEHQTNEAAIAHEAEIREGMIEDEIIRGTGVVTITDDHLKLLRAANVGWSYVEFGSPNISQNRPYGNSDIYRDIHKILDGEHIDSESQFPIELQKRYRLLHVQTKMVLQVCLARGAFETGRFKKISYGIWVKES